MTRIDFPKIIKTITALTKFSLGEVKWINDPTTIRASEFENIVPSIYAHTAFKLKTEKCRYLKCSLNNQNSFKNMKFATKILQN